ncbi:MAG TPA: hypothetical protein VF656_16970 [Pyrinomonadaceae bacterium]|jgi:hypothetical protein
MAGRKVKAWEAVWDVARHVGAVRMILEDGATETQEDLNGDEFTAILGILRTGNVVFSDDYRLWIKS